MQNAGNRIKNPDHKIQKTEFRTQKQKKEKNAKFYLDFGG